MTPRAVLFDCDGVLVDSEPIAFDLLHREMAVHGLILDQGEMRSVFLGGTMKQVAEQARGLGAALPEDWVERFYEKLYARLAQGTPLVDDVAAVLDRLDAAGIAYGVGSNGSRRKMQITLGQHGTVWSRLKDRLYSGQDMAAPKPDPALYLHAAAALGVSPDQAIVVEDSPSGVRAGRGAGMRVLGFAEHDDGAALTREGAQAFHRMADLPRLIGL